MIIPYSTPREIAQDASYSDHGNASWRPPSPSYCPKSYNEKSGHHSPTLHESKSTGIVLLKYIYLNKSNQLERI